MTPTLLWSPLAMAVGLCAGSFVTTASLRAARGEAFIRGRSHCDACAAPISLAAATPLLGYIVRRGTCARCGVAIDPVHICGEIAGALAIAAPVLLVGGARGLLMATLALLLLAGAVYDAKVRRLPDALTLGVAMIATILSAMHGGWRLLEGAIAALLVFAALGLLRAGYRRLRNRDGLGFGDVKLLAALALWLGVATPWALAGAAFLALLVTTIRRRSSAPLAFGPYIASAAVIAGLAREVTTWPLLH